MPRKQKKNVCKRRRGLRQESPSQYAQAVNRKVINDQAARNFPNTKPKTAVRCAAAVLTRNSTIKTSLQRGCPNEILIREIQQAVLRSSSPCRLTICELCYCQQNPIWAIPPTIESQFFLPHVLPTHWKWHRSRRMGQKFCCKNFAN